jgi:hypothetical protein
VDTFKTTHRETTVEGGTSNPAFFTTINFSFCRLTKKKQKNKQEKPKKGVQSFGRQNGKSKIIFSRYDSRDKLVKQKSRRQK